MDIYLFHSIVDDDDQDRQEKRNARKTSSHICQYKSNVVDESVGNPQNLMGLTAAG